MFSSFQILERPQATRQLNHRLPNALLEANHVTLENLPLNLLLLSIGRFK
jgi:hypothetical protein